MSIRSHTPGRSVPRRRLPAKAATLALLGISSPAWAADRVDATVWSELAKVHELSGHFTQVQHLQVLKQPMTSQGDVHFVRPQSLQWNVATPAKSSFSLDGSVAKMDYPDLGMSDRIDLSQVPDANRLATSLLVWMKADAAAVERDFTVAYTQSPEGAVLTPKDDKLKALVSSITLGFVEGPWRVRNVGLAEPNGDHIDIAFTDLVLDGTKVPNPQ